MNSASALLIIICCGYGAFGQAFITTWKTDNPGVSGPTQITIHTLGTGYNYSIAWEQVGNVAINGTVPFPITGDYTITFPSAGIYRVSITGAFPRIFFDGWVDIIANHFTRDNRKILSVEQWGNIIWTSMERAFSGCVNLTIPAIDAPNLTQVTDMSWMFAETESFNQAIEHWNVSHITDMSAMFLSQTVHSSFNQPLEGWDVSSVTDMRSMFAGAKSFNQPLEAWDVSGVVNMSGMFMGARSFNQPIEAWNVSNVKDMSYMFDTATSFNQALEAWNVSSVTNMYAMFTTTSFNQPLGGWDVSSVTDMSFMFSLATNFNQPLGTWHVGSVIFMSRMFYKTASFNQPLGTWNIGSVTNMGDMLYQSGLNMGNYDQTLIGWAAQNVQTDVPLGADGLKYCAGEAARTQLIRNKGWTITGDTGDFLHAPAISLTQPICFGSTGIIIVTVENADDTYSFDNGLTFQTSNIKSGLVAGTYLVINKNNVGCSSTPAIAVIETLFDKPILSIISGSPIVCPHVTAVDYSASIQDYTYAWFINGGTLLSSQNNNIKVDWGLSNFNASVKAVGYDEHNCPTDTAAFPVKIQIELKPIKPQGMDSVCYNFRAGASYQTSYTNGSVYTWFTDGGMISEGQTKPLSKIDWNNVGQYKLWVKEENTTSTDYCVGYSDTLQVTVFKDMAAITMNFVSVDYRDDKKVQIQWDASLLERISDLIIVSRRIAGSNGTWEAVATLQKDVQSFLDQNVNTDQNIYEYKVEGFNKCDEGLQTVIHNTIKLNGAKDEAHELIDLFWNDYNGWDSVERYEVWRKLDSDTTFRLIDLTPGDITNYTGKHGGDGFVHTLRIKAKKKNENTISWSNNVELLFDNPIDFIPNVITPNGDDKNEYFFIPKLNLYPENYLNIYNRWGGSVYQRRNYENDWNANGLPGGIYYYTLRLNRNNRVLKGWVQVIR